MVFAFRSFARSTVVRGALLAAVVGALAGCASEGVELNGKIFDVMGVSSNALRESNRERVVAPRSPLVMPPSSQLANPNEVAPVQNASLDPSWPVDADQASAAAKEQRQAQIKAMCDDREWMERTKLEEFNKVTDNGAACNSQAGSMLAKLFTGSTVEDDGKRK